MIAKIKVRTISVEWNLVEVDSLEELHNFPKLPFKEQIGFLFQKNAGTLLAENTKVFVEEISAFTDKDVEMIKKGLKL